jgi:hypothetical protein
MRKLRTRAIPALLAALLGGAAAGQPAVTVAIESPQAGSSVAPGATVTWIIRYSVSAADNLGLALLCCDLSQDAGNPALFDLPPAAGVPAEMTNFSRPAGIANRGEGGATTGYIGVQRGPAGQRNLVQIGGAQNTLGQALPPGSGIAENAIVIPGVGQSGAVVLASGSFAAPSTPGTYTLRLSNGIANVLTAFNAPPVHSPVAAATVSFAPATISFTVSALLRGDLNCDGLVNNFDIDPFVLALSDAAGYAAQYPDCNIDNADIDGDGAINNFDIDPFVDCVANGGCL